MQLVAIVTLIGVALTVAALAIYLTGVALMLRHVSFTLGTIIAGLRAIAFQAQPLNQVIGEINHDLERTRVALQQLLASKQDQRPATRRAKA